MGCVVSVHSNSPPGEPPFSGSCEEYCNIAGTREGKRDSPASLAGTTSWVEPTGLQSLSFNCHLLEAWRQPTCSQSLGFLPPSFWQLRGVAILT